VTWRVVRRELGSVPAALLAAGALAAGLAVLPLQTARALDDAYDAKAFSRYAAERYGAAGRGFSVALLDRVRQVLPRDAVYYLDVKHRPGATALRFWTRGWLLPRIAVASPDEADWVLSWRGDPDALPVELADRQEVAPGVVVARVAR
jgi:hypothetical protein